MNRLHFDFSYSSTLRTREQIQVTVFFTLDPGEAYRREYFWGSTPMLEVEDRIGEELYAKAQSITNQWALRFSSADAALDPSAYASLEDRLQAIASPQFSVYEVSVSNIVPATPKVVVPPPPPPPPPPKPSRADEIRDEVMESVSTIRAMKTIEAGIRTSDPDLADDPYLGFASQQVTNSYGQLVRQEGLLKRKFDNLKGEILK